MGKAQRERHRLKTVGREWTAWNEIPVTDEIRNSAPHMQYVDRIWGNSRFEAQSFNCATKDGGVVQLVIARHGHLEAIDWNDCLRVKNELFGPENIAVEVYPRGQVPNMKIRILWVLPPGTELPYGLDMKTAWGVPV